MAKSEKQPNISVLFMGLVIGFAIFWSIKKDIADYSDCIRNGVSKMQADSTQAVHELGDASFYLYDYHFRQDNHKGICTLHPQSGQGYGNVYQVQPAEGLFLSTGNWLPYAPMERKYVINQNLVKIYYLESGGVTLIQNGKKAQPITEGIHLYLNKPSQGRVLYQPNIPICYPGDKNGRCRNPPARPPRRRRSDRNRAFPASAVQRPDQGRK